MGDCLQMGKPSLYVIRHSGKLSLAIPLWVGEMSTTKAGALTGILFSAIALSSWSGSVNW